MTALTSVDINIWPLSLSMSDIGNAAPGLRVASSTSSWGSSAAACNARRSEAGASNCKVTGASKAQSRPVAAGCGDKPHPIRTKAANTSKPLGHQDRRARLGPPKVSVPCKGEHCGLVWRASRSRNILLMTLMRAAQFAPAPWQPAAPKRSPHPEEQRVRVSPPACHPQTNAHGRH